MEKLNELIQDITSFSQEIDEDNKYALQVHRGLGFDYGFEYSDEWFDPDKELPKIDHWYTSVVVSNKDEPYTTYSVRGDTVWRSDRGMVIDGPWKDQMVEIATELREKLWVQVQAIRNGIAQEKARKEREKKEQQRQYEQSVRDRWNG